jgi:hypothetical protein
LLRLSETGREKIKTEDVATTIFWTSLGSKITEVDFRTIDGETKLERIGALSEEAVKAEIST